MRPEIDGQRDEVEKFAMIKEWGVDFHVDEDKRYKYYLERVSVLTSHFGETSRGRDNVIIGLSTASIAASIALLGSLISPEIRPPFWILFFSWAMLGVAPISVLLSHSVTLHVTSKEKVFLDEWIRLVAPVKTPNFSSPWMRVERFLNILSSTALSTGLVALICFSALTITQKYGA